MLHWWDDSFLEEEGYTKEEQTELIRREGLTIENAHLRFDHINDLWYDTLAGQSVLEGYLSDIDGLAAQEIPVAVLHPTRGFEAPPLSFVGMSRIHRLVEHSEKRGGKNCNGKRKVKYCSYHDTGFCGIPHAGTVL